MPLCVYISSSLIFFSVLKSGLSEPEEIRTILLLLFSYQVVSSSLQPEPLTDSGKKKNEEIKNRIWYLSLQLKITEG